MDLLALQRGLTPADIPVWFSDIGLVFGIAKARKRASKFFLWRGLIHSKGARTAAASIPIGPRARL